jgi:hypothetical protein
MADTIDLPGLGKVKKQYAIVGGLALVLVAGIAWYRSQGEPDAAPLEQDTSVINPATGFPYGSAEDAYALAGQGFQYSGGIISEGGSGGGGGSGGAPTGGAFVTNGQWSQAAEDYLVNTVGLEPNVVGNALGKYITGGALNPDQTTIVEQAIAFTGYPPVNGPTGYPPSYRTSAEQPPATPPPSAAKPGASLPAPTGLRKVGASKTTLSMTWNPVAGAAGYRIYRSDVGTNVGASTDNMITIGGLRANSTYKIHVRAVGSDGVYSQKSSAVVSMKTAR